jgi:hypothetical protein
LYSIVTLQSFSLGTFELKVQVKELRFLCSYELIHISVKETSQKNIIMKLRERTLYYNIIIRNVSQMEISISQKRLFSERLHLEKLWSELCVRNKN